MDNIYAPKQVILKRYADILVNFALNSGKGVKKGEIVQCSVPDVAKPLAKELQIAILKAGAHPIIRIVPTGFDADYYKYANDEQLTHFPEKFLRAKADMLDHQIGIIADVDPEELKDIDTKKIMKSQQAKYQYREWLFDKERNNQFTWTLGLWGTRAKAKIVGLSIEEYWEQIINACFLDKENPVAEWKNLTKLQQDIMNKLNDMSIEEVHMVGEDVDLKLKIGANRAWKTGSGCNIPSFEHFTSPDWRGTNGWMYFNEPLYRFGNIIQGIRLEFKNGVIVSSSAKKGEAVLKEIISTKNANKLGEFSLTDKRLSRITHPMAETLYDENIGGPFGNSHVAIGMAYKDCYKGDASKVEDNEWKKMGYNNSAVHTDIVSTTNRTVTATLQDGTKKVIYKNGVFVI